MERNIGGEEIGSHFFVGAFGLGDELGAGIEPRPYGVVQSHP
jgi:hypothetical protein